MKDPCSPGYKFAPWEKARYKTARKNLNLNKLTERDAEKIGRVIARDFNTDEIRAMSRYGKPLVTIGDIKGNKNADGFHIR